MTKQGYRTNNRTKIMEFLQENRNKTVTVREIGIHMQDLDCPVNVTTIYRYLDKLEKDGQLMKYAGEKGEKASYQYVEPDQGCDDHLHLQCVSCGAVIHLDCHFMDEIAEHIDREHGFDLQCRGSVIYGLCQNCRPGQRAHRQAAEVKK